MAEKKVTLCCPSDDEDMGPMPASAGVAESGGREEEEGRKKKRRRVLPFENVYLEQLPTGEMYEKSYMHREVVTHTVVSSRTGMKRCVDTIKDEREWR